MRDDERNRKHEMKELKMEDRKEHSYSAKGMQHPEESTKRHEGGGAGGLRKVTMEGSGRKCYPKNGRLNDMMY